MTKKGENWLEFAHKVYEHVENYAAKQYGDATTEEPSGTEWTLDAEECLKNAQKYIARAGRNARAGQEMLDLLKAAHYIQMAATYMELSAPSGGRDGSGN